MYPDCKIPYETFRHSLVGAPIYTCQHYFLIMKIAHVFEIPIALCRVSSFQ